MNETKISVITPIFWPNPRELKECLISARGPNVEHVLVLDGFDNIGNIKKLKKLARKYKARLEILDDQKGISEASNYGVTKATGEFLLFLDQDDFLTKNWWSPLLQEMTDSDMVYSDSFVADEAGKAIRLIRKPNWSPVRLIFNMYSVHFLAVRKAVFEDVGGFRSRFDGAQDHDLALRISRATSRISHIPTPLYYWRESKHSTVTDSKNKIWAYEAGQLAAQEHLDIVSLGSKAQKVEGYPGALTARFASREAAVSIVIPTAFKQGGGKLPLVLQLLSTLEPFLMPHYGDEVVLVTDSMTLEDTIQETLDKYPIPINIVLDDRDFNFSRRCNIGFLSTKNEHILLLNDDIEFGTENPLDSLFGLLRLPNVGLVGGLLAFPDFSIQHSGHSQSGGLPGHAHYKSRSLVNGLFDSIVDHEVSGVTGALMFQLKSTWRAVGGFSPSFPLNFNDVDYCQKVRTLGFSIIQASTVHAIHHESLTRIAKVEEWEVSLMRTRWPDALSVDEFSTS